MAAMMLSSAAPSALGALVSSGALPFAFYGMKTFSSGSPRSSSYLHLTAPQPCKEDKPANSTRSWQFPPELRELNRMAGGFAGPRRYPLGVNSCSMLLDHSSLSAMSSSPSSTFVRQHSIMPHSQASHLSQSIAVSGALQQQQQHTAAATLELPAEVAQPESRLAVISKWFSKTQPRMKGFSRKLALRQVNRKIVARVARRFTIGIPVLGFYFVSKLMVKDLARVKNELAAGEYAVAALFSTALAADILDLAAQATVITGLAHANLGFGLASAAGLLALADKASLATAALSFSCGLSGELISLKHLAAKEEGAKSE